MADWKQIQKYSTIWFALLGTMLFAMVTLPSGGIQLAPEAQGLGIPDTPTVLGAQTAIRGEAAPNEDASPVLIGKFDESKISAKSYLAFDVKTGTILAEKNASEQLSIASLTKLMTALVVYEQVELGSELTVAPSDKFNVTPVLRLVAGDKIKTEDLWSAMLIGSNNDAAIALSRFVSEKTGKNFVDLMNEKAEELGMNDSKFSNVLGFDSWHNYSTVRDLQKLILETQKYYAFTNLGRMKEYKFQGSLGYAYATKATNKLIASHYDIEAIKTGYTLDTQGAMAVKIYQDENAFILIILGSANREQDTLLLKKEIEQNYQWP